MPSDENDPDDDQPLRDIPLSLDAILDILASERRRALLEYLWGKPDNSGSFEEATKYTITKIGRKRGVQPNHDDIQVDLQHHQLPKMADAGVIDYDVRSQTIRYHETERLEEAYEKVQELTDD
ncbi:hypothetical protein ACFQGT_11830 [Natrialbaceae archaeon GCM10025810]|uniref:DUF7344 domain-containing protein n=1 Tax=Halovalidus salilacus TaxID=3075124 RepID=UPI003617F1F3